MEFEVDGKKKLELLDLYVDKLKCKSIFANELYLYFYFGKEKNGTVKYSILLMLYFVLLFVSIPVYLLFLPLFTLVCFFYLLCALFSNCEEKISGKIVIIRSVATFDKIVKYSRLNNIDILSESIVYKNNDIPKIYSFLSFLDIICIVLRFPFQIIMDFKELLTDTNHMLGKGMVANVFYYYLYRIPLSSLYFLTLKSIIRKYNINALYTGNKEDRFAFIEDKVCRKYNVNLICIPHGIEYGFKLPLGMVGNKFYTTTENAKKELNNKYKTKKFVYSDDVANLMFKKECLKIEVDKKVVFFTEARDINVNKEIIAELINLDVDFFVKLHPKDNERNYSTDVKFINDFDFAITNSICICRKSTVLLEALYNDSIALAVLLNEDDRFYVCNVFPSLSDKRIQKVNSIFELRTKILELGLK
ncbi:hypothetical protein ACPV30_15950 [Photobacterium damselae]|uniref:hypothetical protein n=1 Tax=Photobacterium damselae TaxID=38293 RepID=UPI001EFD10DC|nr:hypothetical protein [Photobacterium damselae]MCG9778643.1 hypothetical protein [Photobacterium damselae]